MFSNALVVGIILGFLINISGLQLANSIQLSINMITRCLTSCSFRHGRSNLSIQASRRYRTDNYDLCCFLNYSSSDCLVCYIFGLSEAQLRSAVITAAMAPGINTYVFANIYGRAKRWPQQGYWFLQASQLAQFGFGSAFYPKQINLLFPKNHLAACKRARNRFFFFAYKDLLSKLSTIPTILSICRNGIRP